MNVLTFLNSLRPAIPFSVEKPTSLMSTSELRRHITQKAVIINGETVQWEEEIDFPVFSIVFFPKSNRKTTIV